MSKKFIVLLFILAVGINSFSQTAKDSIKNSDQLSTEIRGVVLDAESQEPLPYTNIIVKLRN